MSETSRGRRNQDYWKQRDLAEQRAETAGLLQFEPHNIAAEAAVLGSIMIDNRLAERVTHRLRSEHFFHPDHARIYELIVRVLGRGLAATPITLRPYFEGERIKTMDDEGGEGEISLSSYLAGLTDDAGVVIGISDIANQVIELATLREVVGIARDMVKGAKEGEHALDPRRVIQEAETRLFELSSRAETQIHFKTSGIADAWDETIEEIKTGVAKGGEPGITINGYDDWNAVVGSMEAGDLIYLGGRPSMGKTGVACAIATGAADAGHATEFLSLEMRKRRITRRMIANLIYQQGVTSTYEELGRGRWTDADQKAIGRAREIIAGYPLEISDPKTMEIEELAPFIRRRQRAWEAQGRELKLLVCDYLGRFRTRKPIPKSNERVGYLSRMTKEAALECGIPIVMLVQLSRAVESRDDKRPMLVDLRDSGELEQDADTVGFVYRDEYYMERSEPPKSDPKKWNAWADEMVAVRDRMELIGAKRREGALVRRSGYFFAPHQAVRSSTFYSGDDLFSDNQGFGWGFGVD